MFDEYFKEANPDDYTNEPVKRKLKILKDVGTAILSDSTLTNLTSTRNAMTLIYNNAKVCPFTNQQGCDLATEGLTLDPDIEVLLASSNNYDEMQWIWESWHDKSGKLMRDDYKKYVAIMNEAAVANSKHAAAQLTFH